MKTEFVVFMLIVIFVGATQALVSCGNGWTCKDYQTCCRHPKGFFMCCPITSGVCCCNGETCCPSLSMCSSNSVSCYSCPSFAALLSPEKYSGIPAATMTKAIHKEE
ncbi:granulin-2-like [Tachypleus tridentatus]|uniref:granulin-2-like n=1 Tax=Tachypleus tridentatus TaxID=6853 RepID=UPI003FD69789